MHRFTHRLITGAKYRWLYYIVGLTAQFLPESILFWRFANFARSAHTTRLRRWADPKEAEVSG